MISRCLAGALALALSCLPAAGGCVAPAAAHAAFEQESSRTGGTIEAINGETAMRVGNVALLRAGWPPARVTLLMVHVFDGVAQVAVFVDGCARHLVIMPAWEFGLLRDAAAAPRGAPA